MLKSECNSSINLGDLIKMVELADVHLTHEDEDIELATISELNSTTLTDEGKAAWSDVLDARVTKIFTGYYGLQIECTDVDTQSLTDFSYMLAGQCNEQDYDKWVNQSNDLQLGGM